MYEARPGGPRSALAQTGDCPERANSERRIANREGPRNTASAFQDPRALSATCLRLRNEGQLPRLLHRLRPALDIELAVDVPHMSLHGIGGDPHAAGDLLVRLPGGQ